MSTLDNTTDFTPMQVTYIKFLAAGKIGLDGKKWSREDFANKVAKVSPATLYDWQRLDGFKEALNKETMRRLADWIPVMNRAIIAKAAKGDVQAYKAMMNQWQLLEADRSETKTEVVTIDAALSE